MELTLTKTQTFELKPYGKFLISMAQKPKDLPYIIPLHGLFIDHNTSMPFSEEQEKEVLKLMRKHKTDILTDDTNFYTRAGGGQYASLCIIKHPKLIEYRESEVFKTIVDNR